MTPVPRNKETNAMTAPTDTPSQLAIHGGTPVRTDLLTPRKCFGPEELKEVTEALDSQSLFYGTKVYAFLDAMRSLYGVAGAVPSTSGTAALHVAVGAINPQPGDEILVSPVTDMGSIAPIILSGAIPVFVDVESGGFNMDPADVAAKITDRTKAIMVIHVWGRPANLDAIKAAIGDRDIAIIEDCAEAHHVRYKGELVGTLGDFGAFSFQQSKHITCGDGGVTLVNRPELLPRASLFVDKGCDWTQDRTYRKTYAFVAPCYRMTELQGAVLIAQVAKLPGIIERRRKAGGWLAQQLQDLPGVVPPPMPDEEYDHGYWGFPLRVIEDELGASRDDFREALVAEGIKSDIWIGKPLYLYDALAQQITMGDSNWPFRGTGREDVPPYAPGLCPNAEKVFTELCNVVRIHEQTSESELRDVATAIRKVARELKG
jgi:dTDP-4-amino-4,6-dideoxygalactose transaminase